MIHAMNIGISKGIWVLAMSFVVISIFASHAFAQYSPYAKTESKTPEMTMGEKIQSKNHMLPPLTQVSRGVLAQDIQCKDNLQLVFTSTNDMPACVKPSSAQRLIEMGWAKKLETNTNNIKPETSNSLKISAVEEDDVYRWSNVNGINPTITVFENVDNTIQIQNPTDARHEFVIESQGEEIAASGDIPQDGSGSIHVKPNMTGIWEYHCEYHPTTMKGTIKIVGSNQ